jgi:hypothetical protein
MNCGILGAPGQHGGISVHAVFTFNRVLVCLKTCRTNSAGNGAQLASCGFGVGAADISLSSMATSTASIAAVSVTQSLAICGN